MTNSVLDILEALLQEIQDLYRSYRRPWVIAFSGGKDSTTVVQLVWKALSKLPHEERDTPIYVIAGDTRVEDPAMSSRVKRSIDLMNAAAKAQHLPISASIVYPALHESFWVLLIGKGFPAPTARFRWCTDRLKIKPSNKFIEERVARFGEVILALGVREQESLSRAQTMSTYEVPGQLLRRHSSLPNASVYAPIARWSTPDVWLYLMATHSPWGDDNRQLRALYQYNDGECPLVIDRSTPSCGSSRMGCWTCSVVSKNTSLETRYELDERESWLLPLIEYRNLLKQTREPGQKGLFCEIEGKKDNRVNLTLKKDAIATRLYTLSTRQMLLRRLLSVQEQVRREGPDPTMELISADELRFISRIHRFEEGDWGNTVAHIYREVTGRDDIQWQADDVGGTDDPGVEDLLTASAEAARVPVKLLKQLLQTEWAGQAMGERATVLPKIEALLKKNWRPLEVKVAEAWKDVQESSPQTMGQEMPPGQLTLFD